MTVSTATRKVTYTGSTSTGPFTFDYRVTDSSHVAVTKIESDGTRNALSSPADYSITLTDLGLSGGSITLTSALVATDTLLIEGDATIEQPTNYANQGKFFPETHETSFDRLTIVTQELREDTDRCLQLGAESALTGPLILPAPEAGKALVWNSGETAIENSASTLADVSTVAGSIANINLVAGDIANINTVASDLTGDNDIGAIITNLANVNLVATNINDINDVAAALANKKLDATVAPTVNNDGVDTAGLGQTFQADSTWYDTSANEAYKCLDASTGAAVWVKTSLTIDELGTMATQAASAVAITGGTVGVATKLRTYATRILNKTVSDEDNVHVLTFRRATRLHNIDASTTSGSVTIDLKKNGTSIGGVDAVAVTTTQTETAVDDSSNAYIDFAAGDKLSISKSAATSAANLEVFLDLEDR